MKHTKSLDRAARQLYQLSFWACFCLVWPSQMWEWRALCLRRGKCTGNTLIKLSTTLYPEQTFSQHANAIILNRWICVYVTPNKPLSQCQNLWYFQDACGKRDSCTSLQYQMTLFKDVCLRSRSGELSVIILLPFCPPSQQEPSREITIRYNTHTYRGSESRVDK